MNVCSSSYSKADDADVMRPVLAPLTSKYSSIASRAPSDVSPQLHAQWTLMSTSGSVHVTMHERIVLPMCTAVEYFGVQIIVIWSCSICAMIPPCGFDTDLCNRWHRHRSRCHLFAPSGSPDDAAVVHA